MGVSEGGRGCYNEAPSTPAGTRFFQLMIKVLHIDHVALAVPELTAAASSLGQLFSLEPTARETVTAQKTDVVFLKAPVGAAGHRPETAIELICPSAPAGNESLQRFLAKRPGTAGLHHICYAVADIRAALASLKEAKVPLIDETPRVGARGHLVAFLHPQATGGVLFELCQAQGDHA